MAGTGQAPGLPPLGTAEEPAHRVKAAVVSLAAVGLGVGVLANVPNQLPVPHHHRARPVPPRTTAGPSGTIPKTTSSVPSKAVHVAIISTSLSSPAATTVKAKLEAAHYLLYPAASVPASWVSEVRTTVIHYPGGGAAAGREVAVTLGLPSSAVSAEPDGTSVGPGTLSVIEVVVPAAP
ncbi:MAG: LytR C-terminal domain-containing protein [Acidimicrobiales bacterium]